MLLSTFVAFSVLLLTGGFYGRTVCLFTTHYFVLYPTLPTHVPFFFFNHVFYLFDFFFYSFLDRVTESIDPADGGAGFGADGHLGLIAPDIKIRVEGLPGADCCDLYAFKVCL